MELTESTQSSQTIFQGKLLKVCLDQAKLPNGTLASREVVYHPGGVAILPLDHQGQVTLVQQYRYPLQQLLLELPAGKLDPGEDPEQAAHRELSEETGWEAQELISLGRIFVSPGFCSEAIHLYLARQLRRGPSHPDPDEFLRTVTMPFSQLVDQVMGGEVEDGKTVAAVLKTLCLLNR